MQRRTRPAAVGVSSYECFNFEEEPAICRAVGRRRSVRRELPPLPIADALGHDSVCRKMALRCVDL